MPALSVSMTGFAIIGLTLFILALTIAVALLRLPTKSTATWWLTGFFAGVAASGAATILANGFFFWDRFFDPWQDTFVILGGLALAQFGYHFPRNDQPREARFVLVVMSLLALLSVGYSLTFNYRFVFQWSPDVTVSDAFYTLLPIGTLLSFAIFLRRSVHFSALAWIERQTSTSHVPSVWQRLIRPVSQEAQTLRSFALALLLGLLPGIASLFPIPGPFDFLLMNVGSLLAMATIALVYFNYTPEMNSFMAKLVGVTLVTVLLIFSVVGTFDYRRVEADYEQHRRAAIVSAHGLLLDGRAEAISPEVAYVAAWSANASDAAVAGRVLYVRPDLADVDLIRLLAQNQQEYWEQWAKPISGDLPQVTSTTWRRVPRYGTFPQGSTHPDFEGYLFTQDDTTFEIALAQADRDSYLSAAALRWMGLIILSSLFVLAYFPLFFRRMLVNPLAHLLAGVTRVNQGDLNTTVPIQYHDEIGALTGSFNTLTHTLKESYEVLEERVTDRTRELSAFSDLTMLPVGKDDLSAVLQPALHRILEAGKCEALGLHLLSPDGRSLELIAHLHLPESALRELQTVALPAAFAVRVQQVDTPLITSTLATQADLPACFKLPEFQSYLGCPLTVDDQALGWLSCYRTTATEFGMSEASFLVALARQVGVIVENHRLRERIGQTAVDEERQRLARELHDAVTQSLYSQLLFARAGRDAAEDNNLPKVRDNLQQLELNAAQALKEMRLLLYQLRPAALQHGDLIAAIDERFNLVERRLGLKATCTMAESVALDPAREDMLYRVVIEALNNSLKHANATTVQVALCCDETYLYLSVQDDGQGFDVEQTPGGMGLSGMQDRVADFGGQLTIEVPAGQGTEIRVVLPLSATAQES
jgi:signal transduction histidine kinase